MKIYLVFLAAALSTLLGACSFQPVYGDRNIANTAAIAFNYAEPDTREEQIVYQTLSLSFPRNGAAPQLEVSALVSGGDDFVGVGRGSVTVTVRLTVTAIDASGNQLFSIKRSGSAQYAFRSQKIANESGRLDARERAARAAAESVRLAILAMNVR